MRHTGKDIKPGCIKLQRFLIMVNLYEIFLRLIFKINFGVWAGQELIL